MLNFLFLLSQLCVNALVRFGTNTTWLEIENIMIWLKVPVFVATITDRDGLTSRVTTKTSVLKNIHWCDSDCGRLSIHHLM